MWEAIKAWFRGEPSLREQIAQLWQLYENLEGRMSMTDLALNELNLATDEVADELDEIRAALTDVDEATASRISAVTTRLRAMAQSEDNVDPEGNVGGSEEPSDEV